MFFVLYPHLTIDTSSTTPIGAPHCTTTFHSKTVLPSTGNFDEKCFLEMMAPLGYRAHDSMPLVAPGTWDLMGFGCWK